MAVEITALINTQARGPTGPAGSDASVTAANVQTALAADPSGARTSAGLSLTTDTNATIFFDDFQRADAGSNALGNAPSGQEWNVTGSGLANQRLSDRSLVNVSPYGTFYAWPGGASGLSFTPVRIGARFRIDNIGGPNSYLGVMGITAAAQSLQEMIHVTWNEFNLTVDLWTGGTVAVTLGTETFVTPLTRGTDYVVEIEVRGDVITVYSPSGKVYAYTNAIVSDKVGPYCYFEASTDPTPIGNVRFLATWARNDSSQKDWFAGRIADAKTAAHGVHFVSLTGLTGNVTSTAGSISMAADTDTTHLLGRSRFHSPSSDYATFVHRDFSAFGQGFQMGNFGNIAMYAGPGQSWAIGANGVNAASGTASTFTISIASFSLSAIPTYADNAAAVSGGLAVNRIYKTSTGEIRIVV